MELSDEMLVHACRQGDQAAWEALIARFQRLVYTIPRRAGLDPEQSTDVFQHVFARLADSIDRIEHPERIRMWLVTVAKRETWRVKRMASLAQFQPFMDEDDSLAGMPDQVPQLEDRLVEIEEQHLLRMALAQMDERCRKLLTLLYYQEDPPPYTEIAAMLGITLGSVGPTRARCLQKLRQLVEALDR